MSIIQMEIMQLQQHLQRLYAQPRTPMIEQEVSEYRGEMYYMLTFHTIDCIWVSIMIGIDTY